MRNPSRPSLSILWLLIVVALLAAACSSSDGDKSGDSSSSENAPPTTDDDDYPGGLEFTLSEGSAETSEAVEVVSVVDGEALSDEELDSIWERLGGLEPVEPDDGYERPDDSLPPPRSGKTIGTPFPVDGGSPQPVIPKGPLEVLRYQPEGDVDLAAFISVTFNQPMVPLGTVGQVDDTAVPIQIQPELPGEWVWLGTRTVRFEHESDLIDRLPMATAYTVTVPAGTTSQTGGELSEQVKWSFTTPPPTVEEFTPSGKSLPLEPVFVATFDQLVEPDAILDITELTIDGESRPISLASEEAIAADESASAATQRVPEGRWVAFVADEVFDPATDLTIRIGGDIPSAEGPATNPDPKILNLSTYSPLRVTDHACKTEPCDPRWDDLWLNLNNELDLDQFDPQMVSIEPEIPLDVQAYEKRISIQAPTQPSTTYSVSLSSELTDVFGQQLGEAKPLQFEIGPARDRLGYFDNTLITTDPLTAKKMISIDSVGHDELRVRALDVDVDDYAGAVETLSRVYEEGADLPDWPVIEDRIVEVDESEMLSQVEIDLTNALADGDGHVVVVVESTETYDRESEDYWENRPAVAWVQSSTIGLDAFTDPSQLVVWTTDLATGAPLAEVSVALSGSGTELTTGPDGVASAEVPEGDTPYMVARRGDESTILDVWVSQQSVLNQSLFSITTDRGTYRPGETASVKGILRRLMLAEDGQLHLPAAGKVGWTARDAQYNEIARGEAKLSSLGGFDFEFEIPAGANLGASTIEVVDLEHGLQPSETGYSIQEFRRPEFEVTTEPQTAAPFYVGEPTTVSVNASYYAGGPLPDAAVDWEVTTQQTSYTPPNWDQFSFGIVRPWLEDNYYGDEYGYDECCLDDYDYPSIEPVEPVEPEYFQGRTDADGSHHLEINTEPDGEGQPSTISANATIYDVNRQAWSSQSDLLIHPGEYYVGLRSEQTFVSEGDPLVIEAIVVDVDGEIAADRSVTIEAGRLVSEYVDGKWTDVVDDAQTCEETSTEEPVSCTFDTDAGGTYQIEATVSDDSDGSTLSRITRWVDGGDDTPPNDVDQQRVTLVPDEEQYQPGDTAQVLVQAPFADAEGLLTIARHEILETRRFQVDGTSTVLDIAIEDVHTPNLAIQVDLVGTTERTAVDGTPIEGAPDRPAFASGRVDLLIPPISRTLTIEATPEDETVAPGDETTVEVSVTDPSGAPVRGAELAVIVVDEAVLALSGYELGDPNDVFYQPIYSYVDARYGRDLIELLRPDLIDGAEPVPTTSVPESSGRGGEDEALFDADAPASAAPAEDDGFARSAANEQTALSQTGSDGETIDERLDFDALAVFEPDVVTGDDGTATVPVTLPDNLTRYRVMVIATDSAERFGSAESNITAQLPLMARPSAPRFLNFGDTFELPVVVQNFSDEEMEVEVALEASNLSLPGVSGKRVSVPANDRVEVRFDAAADQVGTAKFRVVAVSGEHSDAVTTELPVYTPATTESFATYGVVDEGAVAQPILSPEGVFPQFGGLEVDTSSTALQSLTDAVLYLHEYEYQSADAYASRILAIAALRDVLKAFSADGLPSADEIDAAVAQDLTGLATFQNDDGGFAGWEHGRPSEPYRSIQATHALVAARDAGYTLNESTLERALEYLRNIEQYYPPKMTKLARHTLSAYALHVRNLAGDRDAAKATQLYSNAGDMIGMDGLAWLWPIIDDEATSAQIALRFSNAAVETAGAATFSTDYGDDAYVLLYSDRRTDGIVLDALIEMDPTSDLIPKVVAGLLGNQVEGRWDNVQENAFILLALNNYFDTFETAEPDFIARVWLGDTYAAEHEYRGRSTDRGQTLVPMASLLDAGTGDVVVAKDGPGRLYYRLGLRYAPDDLNLDPLDRGFEVSRRYEAIDDPADVSQDSNGVWHIAAGARVRVSLSVVADSRRTNMALIDPLPAGLESLNPELAVTQPLPFEPAPDVIDDPGPYEGDVPAETFSEPAYDIGYWPGTWYEYENLRDDRTEAMTSLMPAGVYSYDYIARATTPGRFIVPPTRAEEIYAPETFGRAGSDVVVID